MDHQYIESHDIVARYLSGDLLVREARAFEKYCLEHPDILAQLPIPVRLKTRLARRPFDDSETGIFQTIPSTTTRVAVEQADADVDDTPSPAEQFHRRSQRRLLIACGAFVLVAVAGVVYHYAQVEALETRLATLNTAAEVARLRAPSAVQSYRLVPGTQGPQSAPVLSIGWPDPPQLLELRIDVTSARFNVFALTVEKTGEARVMQIRRIAPDSNRELRLALNSSAFGPGQYQIQLQGYTWRGELVDAGWLKVDLQ